VRTSKQVLLQILQSLPSRRDWLDPALEAIDILKNGDKAAQKIVRDAFGLGMNVARAADYYSMSDPFTEFLDKHKESL